MKKKNRKSQLERLSEPEFKASMRRVEKVVLRNLRKKAENEREAGS